MSMNPVTSVSTTTGEGWANTSSQERDEAGEIGYGVIGQRAKPSRTRKPTPRITASTASARKRTNDRKRGDIIEH